MKREEMLARVEARSAPWDIVIIGGGASGMGIAVDAATRGYDLLLLRQEGLPAPIPAFLVTSETRMLA